ncbi:lysophospholipid acyltransferase family protein [Fulvivirga lutimaris]|uniref:lysophospholipid acyltransferase family protein n=1 Tax=Fulvivirga lutimaris TaxID=1819566 RepID=UPI0016292893|nr:lysophospholipid acyltransferase family protein [Fulvivirga lutimaris]
MISTKIGMGTFYGLKIWARIFSILNFIPYKIYGKKNIKKDQAYIYTSNHTSFLDIPGIVLAIPTQFRPLAKKELLKIPVFGLIARVVTIVVDRSSQESRKRSLKILKGILKDNVSILIFPEGTQNRSKEPLQPFYSGAFRMAIETGAPIMPMVVLNAGRLMPPGTISIKPGKIKVVFGEAIDCSNYSMDQVNELKDHVFQVMAKLLEDNKL